MVNNVDTALATSYGAGALPNISADNNTCPAPVTDNPVTAIGTPSFLNEKLAISNVAVFFISCEKANVTDVGVAVKYAAPANIGFKNVTSGAVATAFIVFPIISQFNPAVIVACFVSICV